MLRKIREKFKTVDFSDIRLLWLGLVLLLIPMFFFTEKAISPERESSSPGFQKEMSTSIGRSGFSFVQKTMSSGEMTSSEEKKNMFSLSSSEKEWSSAVSQLAQENYSIPDDPSISPEGRKILEAEMDNDWRTANDLVDQQKFVEAIPMLQKLLSGDSDNPYLKTMASSDLCACYEALGKQSELEKEFKRFVGLLENLPKDGGFYARLSGGLQFLAGQKDMLAKAGIAGENREFISKMLQENGLSGQYTPESFSNEVAGIFDRQFPGLNGFKK